MFFFSVLIVCLLSAPRSEANSRPGTRGYRPVIQVTEEIDINEITFTTSAPEFERSSSRKTANFYNGIKQDGKGSYSRLSDTSPSVFPNVIYKDSYGTVVPREKIYTTGQPLVVPAIKYKPYKVFKVQEGLKPISLKPRVHDKSKLLTIEPSTAYETPKQYLTKVTPFSGSLPSKAPTRASSFSNFENKNFIPSPTFSPTVLAQFSNENSQKFREPFTTQAAIDWNKPTSTPFRLKKGRKIPDNHQARVEDFTGAGEENSNPPAASKEAPQHSESFLSEISTLHQAGSSTDGIDGVSDSLDLKTGERVEFQMYGMDGPQSYKFGFDTGKGHNRHFRFEERDNTGKVKGHYGYLDEEGKMRIMKYEADPVTGFHAGPVDIPPEEDS